LYNLVFLVVVIVFPHQNLWM